MRNYLRKSESSADGSKNIDPQITQVYADTLRSSMVRRILDQRAVGAERKARRFGAAPAG